MPAIKPEDVIKRKAELIPEYVFDAVNELIAKYVIYDRGIAVFTQDEVIDLIISKAKNENELITRELIYANHWLNFEGIYQEAGWKVIYDKPAYCEDYKANFTFRAEKSNT